MSHGGDAATPANITADGWKDVAFRVKGKIAKDRVGLLAAGVAFYGLLALFPAITALIAISGLLIEPSRIVAQLNSLSGLVAVTLPVILIKPFCEYSRGVVPITAWGGLKGGISVALALGLPSSDWNPLILTATFIVVLFSIIVQGLTFAPLAKSLRRDPDPP